MIFILSSIADVNNRSSPYSPLDNGDTLGLEDDDELMDGGDMRLQLNFMDIMNEDEVDTRWMNFS